MDTVAFQTVTELFFNDVEKIIFPDNFNLEIMPGKIPNTAKEINFGNSYNHELKAEIIPTSVTKVTIGYGYKKNFKVGVFPNSVIELDIYCNDYTKTEKGFIPNSVKKLFLKTDYCIYYNEYIEEGFIPNSVTDLTLIVSGKQIKKGSIPNSVTHLTLRYIMNSNLSVDLIPDSVTHLTVFYLTDGIKKFQLDKLKNVKELYVHYTHLYGIKNIENINSYYLFYDDELNCKQKNDSIFAKHNIIYQDRKYITDKEYYIYKVIKQENNMELLINDINELKKEIMSIKKILEEIYINGVIIK